MAYPPGDLRNTRRFQRLRLQILERDRWTCQYCGQAANTVDHKDPIALGGAVHDPANLVAACHSCNSIKQHRDASVLNARMRQTRGS